MRFPLQRICRGEAYPEKEKGTETIRKASITWRIQSYSISLPRVTGITTSRPSNKIELRNGSDRFAIFANEDYGSEMGGNNHTNKRRNEDFETMRTRVSFREIRPANNMRRQSVSVDK